MKVDKYYDITCYLCGLSWSTDFQHGMHSSLTQLRKEAIKEGWGENRETGRPVCPNYMRRNIHIK